jgi:toxin CcdB
MTQFCVYRNANPKSRGQYPLLLDVQSELLSTLNTRVVVPLSPLSTVKSKTLAALTPVLEAGGKRYVMLTPQLAGIAARSLGPQVADLSGQRSDIIAALDFLITGI